jgi:two-component system response regulator YesN
MQALIVQIVRRALQGEPDGLAERALAYIRAHYREPVSNADLAAEFHFHPSTIARAFRRHTGAPPHRYLAEYRVRQAVGIMEYRAVTIEQAARTVGFDDANYFSRYFKKVMGISPSAYLSGARDPRRAPEGVIDRAIDRAPDL